MTLKRIKLFKVWIKNHSERAFSRSFNPHKIFKCTISFSASQLTLFHVLIPLHNSRFHHFNFTLLVITEPQLNSNWIRSWSRRLFYSECLIRIILSFTRTCRKSSEAALTREIQEQTREDSLAIKKIYANAMWFFIAQQTVVNKSKWRRLNQKSVAAVWGGNSSCYRP